MKDQEKVFVGHIKLHLFDRKVLSSGVSTGLLLIGHIDTLWF